MMGSLPRRRAMWCWHRHKVVPLGRGACHWPAEALELTPSSLRSAEAFGRGSGPASRPHGETPEDAMTEA
jgi:hypothetical protein